MIKIEKTWNEALKYIFEESFFINLIKKIREEYLNKIIYPKPKNIFNAFNLCPINKVKIIIIGQDPYHGPNQAHGLSFSVQEKCPLPPSLKNIFKELNKETINGDLTNWATQGVFLLNSILTVQKGEPTSHKDLGWEEFTDNVIKILSKKRKNLVFLLWGNYAKQKIKLIDENKHLILTAAHPSPFSANNGFFGCNHFNKANDYLKKHDIKPVEW